MKINCIVVDDEPLARKGLAEYIGDVDYLDLKAVCENAVVTARVLAQQKIDLIFLDIQMPKMSGIEFLKSLRQQPMIIFTTAYSEYALKGYELDVLDYLVKPISFERFLKAVNKAREFYNLRNNDAGMRSPEPVIISLSVAIINMKRFYLMICSLPRHWKIMWCCKPPLKNLSRTLP